MRTPSDVVAKKRLLALVTLNPTDCFLPLAVAMKVYALAKEKRLGRELPFWAGGASSHTSKFNAPLP